MNRLYLLMRKWWFWLIVLIIISGAAGAIGNAVNPTVETTPPIDDTLQPSPSAEATPEPTTIITASPAQTEEPTPTSVPTASPSPTPTAQSTESPAMSASSTIQLISLTSPIGRNQTATLEIKGAPNTEYNISVYYSSGASEAKGLGPAKSNSEGYVSWSWKIGGKTSPGQHNITISGGGDTLETSITTE